MGLGGATVVSLLGRADGQVAPTVPDSRNDGRQRLGYNPALEARDISEADWKAVRSQKASSQWATATLNAFEKKPRANL
jgi:sterol carrier protein 2